MATASSGMVDAGAGRPDEIAGAREIVRWAGGQSRALGMGRAPSRSPDGRWLIFARDRAWILKDEHTGKVRIYDAGRQISAFNGAPVWSRDSRFVAVNYDLQGESIFRRRRAGGPSRRGCVLSFSTICDGAPAPSSLQIHPQLLAWDVRQPEPFVQATGGHGAYTGDWPSRWA